MSSSRHGRPVHRVLAVAGPEQGPRDRHLGELCRKPPGRVVDRERDLGAAERRPLGGAGEDDVVHLRGADHSRSLRPEHPRHGVDDVRLSGAVRADDDRDARLDSSVVGSAKDLNPRSVSDLRYTARPRYPVASRAFGDPRAGPAPDSYRWQPSQQYATRARESDLRDRRAAPAARLPGPAVDLVASLVAAELAHQVPIALVAERRAPQPRWRAGGWSVVAEARRRVSSGVRSVAATVGAHLGPPADLVGVEVADPRDDPLVGEGRLEGERRPARRWRRLGRAGRPRAGQARGSRARPACPSSPAAPVTYHSPKVLGSTKRTSLPSSRVMTTWVWAPRLDR